MSAWIRMIADDEAEGLVKRALDQARTPHGTVDNVMRVHSLRPHTMHGHTALYRSVLHHEDNENELWFLETAGTYTSILNQCDYSTTHHSSNLHRLLNDEKKYELIMVALRADKPDKAFAGKKLKMLNYVRKLTRDVGNMVQEDVEGLKDAGCTDGEILELNQVVGYFCYVNRLLNGLGVTTQGDIIGYYR